MLSKVYVLGRLEVGLRCWNELWISSSGREKEFKMRWYHRTKITTGQVDGLTLNKYEFWLM